MFSYNIPAPEQYLQSTTELIQKANSGSNSLSVKNNTGFVANDYIIIEPIGNEIAELNQVSSLIGSNTVALLNNLNFAHYSRCKIKKVLYNQVRLYSSPTETGTYALVETKSVTVDTPQGTYFNYTGTDSFFKFSYYNSTNNQESELSEVIISTDFKFYATIDEIREEAGFKSNEDISDALIKRYRLRTHGEIDTALMTMYVMPLWDNPNFANSQAYYLLKQIEVLLTAGRLQYKEYGKDASGLEEDGVPKIKEAYAMFGEIKKRKNILIGIDNNPLPFSTFGKSVIYGSQEEPIFSTNDVY